MGVLQLHFVPSSLFSFGVLPNTTLNIIMCPAVLELGATHVSTKTYGTVAYMPAEVLTKGKLSLASDVYSFSMISE